MALDLGGILALVMDKALIYALSGVNRGLLLAPQKSRDTFHIYFL